MKPSRGRGRPRFIRHPALGNRRDRVRAAGRDSRSAPARSEDGIAIPKEEEVFVVRYEKGVAYVRRWEDGSGQWPVNTSDQWSVAGDQNRSAATIDKT